MTSSKFTLLLSFYFSEMLIQTILLTLFSKIANIMICLLVLEMQQAIMLWIGDETNINALSGHF